MAVLAGLYECTGRAIALPVVGVGSGGNSEMLCFTLKFFM